MYCKVGYATCLPTELELKIRFHILTVPLVWIRPATAAAATARAEHDIAVNGSVHAPASALLEPLNVVLTACYISTILEQL